MDTTASLPGANLVFATTENGPVPHCKNSGVIGPETDFDLLLPKHIRILTAIKCMFLKGKLSRWGGEIAISLVT